MTNDEALVERVVAEIKRSAAILRPDELAVLIAGVMRQALSASVADEVERLTDKVEGLEVAEARGDALMLGAGYVQFLPNGEAKRLDPTSVTIRVRSPGAETLPVARVTVEQTGPVCKYFTGIAGRLEGLALGTHDLYLASEPAALAVPTEMSFSEAMRHVEAGGVVRRADWNRPLFVRQTRLDGLTIPILAMTMRDGTVGPYTPSGCDMAATDWTLAEQRL